MRWFSTRSRAKRVLLYIGLGLLTFGISKVISGCSDEGGNTTSNGFPQPQVRQASVRELNTTLKAQITTNTLQDVATGQTFVIQGPTYEGMIPGPTLIVQPGDTLNIDLVNDFPANPPSSRGGAFHHFESYTTNLHTHGLTVSPQGISDNVLREMQPGGTHNQVLVHIPGEHTPGTFWYHPHNHGSVTFQFLGGMAGMLIIKGGAGTLDAVPGSAGRQRYRDGLSGAAHRGRR